MNILEELEKTQKPVLIKDIFSLRTNITILTFLSNVDFKLSRDSRKESRFINGYVNDAPHSGWIHDLAESKDPNSFDSFALSLFATIISDTVCQKLNIKNYEIRRVLFNYYNANQNGAYHVDFEDDNCISILYNLHKTDGGLELNNKFYEDVAGEAKVFKSTWTHRGIGPKKDKARSNVNISIKIK